MSGSDLAAKTVNATEGSAAFAQGEGARPGRLAWPAATLLILLLSAGLWFAIAMLVARLIG